MLKPFIPVRVAEIIFALVFMLFGINHLIAAQAMAGGVPHMFPGGVVWVYASGVGFILAGIAIVTNLLKTLACYLLAFVLLVFVFTIHVPAYLAAEGAAKAGPRVSILKDIAIAMGALIIGNHVNHHKQKKPVP